MQQRTRARYATAIAIALLMSGCSKDSTTTPNGGSGIAAIIVGVQTSAGTAGILRTGSVPTASGGPAAFAPSHLSMINGGSAAVQVTGSGAMTRILVAISNMDGYYEVTLPTASAAAQLLITFAQTLTQTSLPLLIVGGDATGKLGASASITASVTHVGTGQVQVSLSWDKASDIDLHVIDPSNSEIYYSQRSSNSGGLLDLDSNAGCSIDNVNNENITWASSAPSGTYKVLVDNWSSCSQSPINYVVTVTVAGRAPQTFSGQFTDSGDQGGAGSGRLITTFTK